MKTRWQWWRLIGQALLGMAILTLTGCAGTPETPQVQAVTLPPPPVRSPLPLAPAAPAVFAFSAPLQNSGYEIYLANTGGKLLQRLTNGPGANRCPAFSPDGTHIAYCSERDGQTQLYLMQADGSGQQRLTEHITGCGCSPDAPLSWSPDGLWIALISAAPQSMSQGKYDLFAVSADGKQVNNLTNDPQRYGGGVWDPDSRALLLGLSSGGQADIYRVSVEGGEKTPLLDQPLPGGPAGWSPDGQSLLYVTGNQSGTDIYSLPSGGSTATQLTSAPGLDLYPVWFPNGRQILFASKRDGDYEIYRMNAAGSDQTNLTHNPGVEDMWHTLSPDGSKILYLTMQANQWDSWLMNADGSGKTRLTDVIGIPASVSWKK